MFFKTPPEPASICPPPPSLVLVCVCVFPFKHSARPFISHTWNSDTSSHVVLQTNSWASTTSPTQFRIEPPGNFTLSACQASVSSSLASLFITYTLILRKWGKTRVIVFVLWILDLRRDHHRRLTKQVHRVRISWQCLSWVQNFTWAASHHKSFSSATAEKIE